MQTLAITNDTFPGLGNQQAILSAAGPGLRCGTDKQVPTLQSGQIASAALDACDLEPIPADSPSPSLPNVVNGVGTRST